MMAASLQQQRERGEKRLVQLQQLLAWLKARTAGCQQQAEQHSSQLEQSSGMERQASNRLSSALQQWARSQKDTGFCDQVRPPFLSVALQPDNSPAEQHHVI